MNALARDENHLQNPWCARLGSNQQPLPSEGSTLSIELRTQERDCTGRPFKTAIKTVSLTRR